MTTPSTYKLGYPALKYSTVPFAGSFTRDPTTADVSSPTVGGPYRPGTMWINQSTSGVWIFTGIVANAAQWQGVTDPATGNVDGPATATDNALARFDGTTGKLIQNSIGLLSDAGVLTGVTQMGIGIAPTARLTLAAGTATAGTAPLKLTQGVNLTSPEAGAIEFDGTNLFYTTSGASRQGVLVGPTSATDNALARFDGTTGKLVQNSVGILSDTGVLTGLTNVGIGIAPTSYLTLAAGTATAGTSPAKFTSGTNLTVAEAGAEEFDGNFRYFSDSVPNRYTYMGILSSTSLTGGSIPVFGTGAKMAQSTVLISNGVMTFPAGGGNVLTTGGGAARKGSGTFTGGASGDISTTSVAADSVIAITRTNLSGAAAALGQYVTITPGVKFTVTSGDVADTSSFTWAIVG